MLDKKTIIIIVLCVLLISVASVYAYDFVSDKYYNQGINDATLIINQQILNSLEQNGYVPYIYVRDNQTYNIRLGIIQNE